MSVNYDKMTVAELRKTAKELGVKLASRLTKQAIIDRLTEHENEQQQTENAETAVQTVLVPPAPVRRPVRTASIITDDEGEDMDDTPVLTVSAPVRAARTQVPAKPAAAAPEKEKPSSLSSISSKAPAFTLEGSKSWHNPRAYQPSYSSKSSYPSSSQRPYNADRSAQDRSYSSRGYTPVQRNDFGGYASQSSQSSRFGPDIPENGRGDQRSLQDMHAGPQMPYRSDPRPAESPVVQSAAEPFRGEASVSPSPAVSEMLATGECGDSAGILEIHADGYGFLRTDSLNPGKKDVYVSNAQIRRFNLRNGDHIIGKTRPQRDGDRYSALLYITQVNGIAPEENTQRACFENLTPIYPLKQIRFSDALQDNLVLKAIDLFCPIGYGQRAAIIAPPRSAENALVTSMMQAISRLNPDAHVISLLIDARPEDVTERKDQGIGEVISTTIESSPENHIHTAELCVERSMRLVEQKKDVILFLDDLTRLGRALNALAPATVRSLAGGLAAGSTFRARKLFGAARNLREGGSLTIIALLSSGGQPLEDAILDDFSGTGNMRLVLKRSRDASPAFPDLSSSFTRKCELMQSEQEKSVADQLRAQIKDMEDPDAFLGDFLSAKR